MCAGNKTDLSAQRKVSTEEGRKLAEKLKMDFYETSAKDKSMVPAPCTLHPAPCTLNHEPCTLHPEPCTLHFEPCSLHRAPCTLNPEPQTLSTVHNKPCALNPELATRASGPSPVPSSRVGVSVNLRGP
jgi:hypothetical protein